MIYIIGDVHGCFESLKALIKKLPKNAKVVFVGDLVDRGSSSKEVIDFIIENNYFAVLGNHELKMYETIPLIIEDINTIPEHKWIQKYGGLETLKSYCLDGEFDKLDIKKLQEHQVWLEKLPLYLEFKDIKNSENRYLVVSHSNVSKFWKYRDFPKDSYEYIEFEKHVLKSRNMNILDNPLIYNVFGHTPTPTPDIKKYFANIDTGCVYKNTHPELGNLTALEFPSLKIFSQENIDN